MRLVGCALLLSGLFIALAALVMMPSLAMRLVFVASALGVEVLGVGLLTRAYTLLQKEQR